MKLFVCDGYWIDTKENFKGMVVSDGEWNGNAAIEMYFEAIGNETPIYVKGAPLTNKGVPVWE